jgi:DNA invertase Pin-like site-specific DNA recombinase
MSDDVQGPIVAGWPTGSRGFDAYTENPAVFVPIWYLVSLMFFRVVFLYAKSLFSVFRSITIQRFNSGGRMRKRVGIYLRVSTDGQTTQNQRRELEAVASRSGWEVVGIYEDAGISGAKGREKRPGFDRLLRDATARKVDMIAAWSVDRLGRSLQHLVGLLQELQALKCDLYLHQQAIDTSTPSGRAMFQMCGVFAEFERAIIVERVNAGLKRAKRDGIKLGRGKRKDGSRSLDEERWGMSRAELEKRILRLRKDGTGILKIAKTLGIGTSVVQGVVRPFEGAVASA